jgi:predicted Zn finger-like uncharacterized protein
MKFSCDQCSAQYMIADEKVGTRGVKVKCKKCGHVIVVRPAAVPEPAAPERHDTVVAEPGTTGLESGPFNEPTMAMSASQLAGLKAAAAGGEAMGSPAGASAPAPEPEPEPAPAPSFASSPAFSPSPFSNPFGSETTHPEAERPTLPPISQSEPEMPAPASDSGGFDGVSLPAPEGRSSGEFNLDRALGTAPAVAPVPSGRPAGEKEWYVAIDEAQIGPVDLREVEQRWDAKELSEDSLSWKAGMGDWMPIAEIPELAYLVTERPQQKPQAPAGYANMPAAAAASGSAHSQSMGPMAFAGSDVEISGVSWKPSAASALSSLVQEELVSTAKPAEEPVKSGPSASDMGMPSFGATDLFGKGGNGGTGVPAVPAGPSFAPAAGDPFAASQNWSVPKPVQSSGIKPMTLLLAAMGLVVVGLIAVVVVVLVRPQPQPQAPIAAVTPPPTIPAPGPGTTRSASPDDGTVKPGLVEPPDVGGTKVQPGKSKVKGKGKTSDVEDKSPPAKGKGKDPLKDLFEEDKKPAAAAASNLPATPSRDDVMNGVRTNAKLLGPCLQAAKAKAELAPGKHVLVLDFLIKPNGSVTDGQLKGPAYVMSTSMPGCFAQKMKSWTFPPSKGGAPVKNFPLPFTMQ